MKQLIQSFKSGEITIEDVPAPVRLPGGVVIATQASLVSAGTERQIVGLAKKSLLGKAKARPDLVKKVMQKVKTDGVMATIDSVRSKLDQPFPMGYSCAGIVTAVGDGVTEFAEGDRVACGGQGYASHAESNWVPKNLCVKIPEGVEMASASFVTLGAIAMQGVRQADVRLGEVVAVVGLGLIGQIVVQLLKSSGCVVLGCDLDPAKVELAKSLGCDEAVVGDPRQAASAMTGGRGVDAAIIAASTDSDEPIETAGELCRMKGKVVVLGAVGMNVPRKIYYERELDLRLSMSYGPGRYDPDYEEYGHDYPYGYVRWTEKRNMESFLRLVAEGKVKLEKLLTHRFDINEALRAYDMIQGRVKERYMGIVLTYPALEERKPTSARLLVRGAANLRPNAKAVAGVIGAGNFAQGILLPNLAKVEGVRLRGLAEVRGEVARHVANKFDFEFCSADYHELINDSDINSVFITTRHNTHAQMVIDALNAGKNVYVEKPLCMNDDDLRRIVDAYEAQDGRCRLMVGFNRRFAPLMRKMKGAFATCRTPLVMLCRVNAGPAPRSSWVQSSQEGGGRIIGEACHFIDLLGYLAGSPLKEVTASSIGVDRDDVMKEDNVCITLRYDDGSLGTVLYTSLGDKAFPKEYCEAFGGGDAAAMDNFRRLTVVHAAQSKTTKSLRQEKGHFQELEAFAHAVTRGEPSPIPFEDIVATTRATFQVREALRRSGGERAQD